MLQTLFLVLLLLAVVVSLGAKFGLFAGRTPADLGTHDGRLKPPSMRPNGVSSQAGLYPDHPQRAYAQIEPLPLRGGGPQTLERLRRIVAAMPGARVARSDPGYLHVLFVSRWMGFVDDAEFWFDPRAGVIQVRSASRLGRSDGGANRARIEQIRARLAA
ncbi:DUF1499 domain-containing protein [Piscinibacter sp.]|uniref:DUF1499 domain-containing protein n=1 Tax=Piscinibacter sp. TaxID=1903157 RepID=UPI0039E6FA41